MEAALLSQPLCHSHARISFPGGYRCFLLKRASPPLLLSAHTLFSLTASAGVFHHYRPVRHRRPLLQPSPISVARSSCAVERLLNERSFRSLHACRRSLPEQNSHRISPVQSSPISTPSDIHALRAFIPGDRRSHHHFAARLPPFASSLAPDFPTPTAISLPISDRIVTRGHRSHAFHF